MSREIQAVNPEAHQINLTVSDDTIISINDGRLVIEVIPRLPNGEECIVVYRANGEEYVLKDFQHVFVRDAVGALQPVGR